MTGSASPTAAHSPLPSCVARIQCPVEQEAAKALVFSLSSIQRRVGLTADEKSACPVERLGEQTSYRIVKGATWGRSMPWRLGFDPQGVTFIGQAAGIIEVVTRNGLTRHVTEVVKKRLEEFLRIMGDPRVSFLQSVMMTVSAEENGRREVKVFEVVFPPLRVNYVHDSEGKPVVIWIDSLIHPEGGDEDIVAAPVAHAG